MAFQAAQMYFIQAGFMIHSHVNLGYGSIELTVHFDLPNMPTIPSGYTYSYKELTSHTYWDECLNKLQYVRCLTLYFGFQESK